MIPSLVSPWYLTTLGGLPRWTPPWANLAGLGGRHRPGSAADLAGCEAAAETWELSSLAGLQAGGSPWVALGCLHLGVGWGAMVGNMVGNMVEYLKKHQRGLLNS